MNIFGRCRVVRGVGVNISELPYVRVLLLLEKGLDVLDYDYICRLKEKVVSQFDSFIFDFEERAVDW